MIAWLGTVYLVSRIRFEDWKFGNLIGIGHSAWVRLPSLGSPKYLARVQNLLENVEFMIL